MTEVEMTRRKNPKRILGWLAVLTMAGVGCQLFAQDSIELKKNADGCLWTDTRIDGICQAVAENPNAACAAKHLKKSVIVDGYTFQSYRSDEGACLRVLRDGKEILRRTYNSGDSYDNGYTLGQSAKTYHLGPKSGDTVKIPIVPNGADLTGLGHPDMIVRLYTGGAHCCTYHYVFELEPKFRLVALLDAADTDFAYFADLDHNRHYFYLTEDWAFAYWPGSFAGSPNAPIVLEYRKDEKGGGFHLALDKMRKPSPGKKEWAEIMNYLNGEIAEQKAGYANGLSTVLWAEVLQLLYSGHEDLAWKLADETANRAKLKQDLGDFCSILKTSQYWPDLKPSLKHIPPACEEAKPDTRDQ
jgi:hypothetical protein